MDLQDRARHVRSKYAPSEEAIEAYYYAGRELHADPRHASALSGIGAGVQASNDN